MRRATYVRRATCNVKILLVRLRLIGDVVFTTPAVTGIRVAEPKADAAIRKSGKKVVGAKRGNGQTVIRVATGSGDCVISPRERS